MKEELANKKCCGTCDNSVQLCIGDTPTNYYFCRLRGAQPLVLYDVCENYKPKSEEEE